MITAEKLNLSSDELESISGKSVWEKQKERNKVHMQGIREIPL